MDHGRFEGKLAPHEGCIILTPRPLPARAAKLTRHHGACPTRDVRRYRLDGDHRDKLILHYPLVKPHLQDHLPKLIVSGVKVLLEQRPEEVAQ